MEDAFLVVKVMHEILLDQRIEDEAALGGAVSAGTFATGLRCCR